MATKDWQSRSRSTLAFAIAFSVIGLLVTIGLAAIVIPRLARRLHRTSTVRSTMVGWVGEGANAPQVAQMPSGLAPAAARAGEMALNEANADHAGSSGNETTLIKTFPLDERAAFALKNINGSITISSWDQSKAEVKAIQSGLDQGNQVFFTNDQRSLSIRTGPSGAHQDLRYEIKLPRKIGRVELNSVSGSIKLSGVTGQIFIESANGSVELVDVVGVSKIQTGNGKITAMLQRASDGPMEFVTVNGKIDVTINSDFDAQLDASTIRGSVNIDDHLGIPVQKEMVGQHARGQIGSGGQPLKLTAINGSVKLSKQ